MDRADNGKKKKRKRSHGAFLSFLVLAFVFIIVTNVLASYGKRIETTIVSRGTEEDFISANGYIFRDQTVIYAPADGYLYCEAAEDERVKSGQAVMYIYKNEINVSVSNQLKEIEREIGELSEGLRTADVFSSDTAKIEQSISRMLRGVPKLGARNHMEQVSEIRESVNELIEKRRIISGEEKPLDSQQKLAELRDKKAELEKMYDIEKTIIHAPQSGAFTARIDGAEEMLSLSAIENLSSEYIKELDKLKIETKTPETVAEGQPVGKIVKNFLWSIAVQIPAREAEGLLEGNALDIRFPDVGVETVTGTISKILPENGGKVILVISSNKYVNMVYSLSKTKVELVKKSYGGFRIPAKSLRMQGNDMGVYVIRNDKARFIPVELLYNGKDWVVVKEIMESAEHPSVLKLYDELIVSGKNIYNDKVVR